MKFLASAVIFAMLFIVPAPAARAGTALQAQNEQLFHQMQSVRGLTDSQIEIIEEIFANSGFWDREIPPSQSTLIPSTVSSETRSAVSEIR